MIAGELSIYPFLFAQQILRPLVVIPESNIGGLDLQLFEPPGETIRVKDTS